jgi:hypothetical protein
MFTTEAPICWRAYPEPQSPEEIERAFDVFWTEYVAATEWTAARGLPQPSLNDFLEAIAVVWNDLAAWQPNGLAQ